MTRWIARKLLDWRMWITKRSAQRKIRSGERLTADQINSLAHPHLRNAMAKIRKEVQDGKF